MGMHEKISPKRKRFGIGDAPWGLPPSVIHLKKALFMGTFSSQIACLYLEPFQIIKLRS